jgi:hypothetical protein
MDGARGPLPGAHTLLTSARTVPPGPQTALPEIDVVLIGLAALGIVMAPFLWPMVRHLSVMAHEGAHATAGVFLGIPPLGVELARDATGGTAFDRDSLGGSRAVIIALVGYLGPSAFGLCAAKLIETGHVVTVLWLAIILLVGLLFLIRESFGKISVPAAIALLALLMHYGHDGGEKALAYGLAWLLLLSGVRVVLIRGANSSDAEDLNALTRLPRQLWFLLWLAGTLLAVAIGGKWMVLRS